MIPLRWLAGLAFLLPGLPPSEDIVLASPMPSYELALPAGYGHTTPRENPFRYVRSCGRDSWETISLILATGSGPLAQNPAGITPGELLPFVTLPPDAKRTFFTVKWQDFDIGVIEYRAVVKDLPVIGLSAVLPLRGKAITLTLYAPEPLERELREEFRNVLGRVKKTSSPWITAEDSRKIETGRTMAIAGMIVAGLYPLAWGIAFRGHPMRAHWVRTAWFVVIALLLFYPISSPGEITLYSNLLLNGVVPLAYLLLAARRIKIGVEMD
jgi:hypothetical protein